MEMEQQYDLIIVGCGPAGLSAAINARIREKNLLLLGGEVCTAKLQKAPHVENYLGFHDLSGQDLRQKFLDHAGAMGIQIENRRVDVINPLGDYLQLLSKNDVLQARTIILATGLDVPKYLLGEQELLGKGVGYCATCDGPLYRGKRVIVLGEVEEAQEEANFLAEICKEVTYISGHGKPDKLDGKVRTGEGIPLAVKGEGRFAALETKQGSYEGDGLFIIREVRPVQDILPGLELDGNFIKTDRTMATNIAGVFAAGDCTGPPYQVAKSVGEGLIAALSAVSYLEKAKHQKEKVLVT